MAFFDKLNQVAKTATDKANEAIGTGKITVKIKKEEYGIEEQYRRIGEYYYQQRCAGVALDPEVDSYCVAIDLAKATIAELQEELQDLKTAAPEEASAEFFDLPFEPVAPEKETAAPVRTCKHCGAEVAADAMFCGKCGEKLDEE